MSPADRPTVSNVGEERQQRLAERLREAREYLGLSQQFVADQTGIPRLAISAMENGKRKVDALEIQALAGLYSYPVDYFLEGSLTVPATIRALAREASTLTERDQEEVIRFAQFLRSYNEQHADTTRSSRRGQERQSS